MSLKQMAMVLAFLTLTLSSKAQTPPPAPTPSPNPTPVGWTFSTSAGYSNVSNAPTNNGFASVTELRLSEYVAIRGDVFLMTNPQLIGSYVGPEYIIPATKLFKAGGSGAFDAANVEFFVNAKIGDIRSTDPLSQNTKAKFSWGIGGGFNIKLSEKTFIRPLDISYLRGSVFTGPTASQPFSAVLGNHLQAAALLGVRF